jgi:hypothetical protein
LSPRIQDWIKLGRTGAQAITDSDFGNENTGRPSKLYAYGGSCLCFALQGIAIKAIIAAMALFFAIQFFLQFFKENASHPG